jgi:hypothetical protein
MHWARAAPLVSALHDRLKLQELQNLAHRNSLAEQPEVYAGHRLTSSAGDREEEPVLGPPDSALLIDRADSIVRLGRHSRDCWGSLVAAEVSELAIPGLQGSPVLSIRHMITAVRRITATRAIFEPRRRLIRKYQARTV